MEAAGVVEAGKAIVLAGQEYRLLPKSIAANYSMRKKVGEIVGCAMRSLKSETKADDGLQFDLSVLMETMIGDAYDRALDLLFLYEPTLPRKEILANATDEELAEAIMAVLELITPFILSLFRMAMKMKGLKDLDL